jgi:hypothetical protein
MTDRCNSCDELTALFPLHGDKGGVLLCPLCIGKWHAEHGRKRNRGRVVVRAIRHYLAGGGSSNDITKLANCANFHGVMPQFDALFDRLGFMDGIAKSADETIELTSELLADVLVLVHPDKQPPERQELAHRVTTQLLALKPFVFPAMIPPPPQTQPRPPAKQPESKPADTKPTFPCATCRSAIPFYYCDPCKAEWKKRCEERSAREKESRLRSYQRRKERRLRLAATVTCICGKQFKGKRKDARFCSATCRQRAHRGVTAINGCTVRL